MLGLAVYIHHEVITAGNYSPRVFHVARQGRREGAIFWILRFVSMGGKSVFLVFPGFVCAFIFPLHYRLLLFLFLLFDMMTTNISCLIKSN